VDRSRVSAIILAWNGVAFLATRLTCVSTQRRRADEVIVVDNASSDDSAAVARSHPPRPRVVVNERNLGFAGGMNVGARMATGDILVLLSPDVTLAPDWIERVVALLGADPSIGVLGGKLFYPDGRTSQNVGGIVTYPLALADHRGYGQSDAAGYGEPRDQKVQPVKRHR
jgi:GT2 family glycosyltransferase